MVTRLSFPSLETERLLLRGLREDDLDGICEIYSDAEHARFVGGVKQRYECWDKLLSMLGHWHLRGFGRFAIEEKSTGAFLGHCGPNQDATRTRQEINYSLTPAATGKGFASEATKRVLFLVYRDLGWAQAVSIIERGNSASENLARRLGATTDGVVQKWGNHDMQTWQYPEPAVFEQMCQKECVA